jgi:hypothetical protein
VIGVSSVVGKIPAVVIHGDAKAKGAVAVTVRNDSGSDFNGPVAVSVFASQDAIADVADVAVAQSAKPLKLKVGQTKAVKFKLALANLPEGSFTLIGAATVDNLTSSANGPSLSVQAPFVHLVNGGAAPAVKPITGGKKASLAVPLRNDGNVPTTKSPAAYTLIVSTDGTEAGAVFQTTAAGKLALKPATAKPQKLSLTFPAGSVLPGSYTLIVKVNAELNDTNDQIVTTLPVTFV